MAKSARSFLEAKAFLSGASLLLILGLLMAPAGDCSAEDTGPKLRFTNPGQRVQVAPFEKAPFGRLTIELLLKIEKSGGNPDANLVSDRESFGDYCMIIRFDETNEKLYSTLNTSSGSVATESGSVLGPGLWYHIACVADGSKLTLYVNGKMDAETPYSGDLINTDNLVYVGSDGGAAGAFATLDEVRIWNAARSEMEIRYFMHRRVPAEQMGSNLAAYWQLDEGAGDVANDASGNARNGTLLGGPKWVEMEMCKGDFKGDGFVDGLDLAYLTSVYGWNGCGSKEWPCPGDFNADTNIDELDLSEFAACFGRADCRTKHVYAIVDVMVAEYPYSLPSDNGYTGLRFGACTDPYIPGLTGTQLQAVDVNTGIGGTTTGIWARYAHLPLNWAGPVLTDIEVTHWPYWDITCPSGWVTASGTSAGIPGALTTQTAGACWANGLCVRYDPLSDSETFISNLCLSDSNGVCPVMCETEGTYWPMECGAIDIHRGCGDDRFVYLGHNNARPWPPTPEMPEFSDEEKHDLLARYAPRVWLAQGEGYMPSSVEWAFPYLYRFSNPDAYWLHTKEPLPEPSSVLDFFYGDLASAPVYAYWIEKQIDVDGVDVAVFDLVYFFYYPYNRGKYVWWTDTTFGHHVGDWEHVTVRLGYYDYDEVLLRWTVKPLQVYVSAHDFGGAYGWEDVRVGKTSDTHPVVYSARGSHGLWINAGNHKYDEVCVPPLGPCADLVDECSEGTAWDTWNTMVVFEFDPLTRSGRGLQGNAWPTWMSEAFTEPGDCGTPSDPACGAIYRWGNPQAGSVAGYYRLENGPTGPISKGVMTSKTLQ